MGGQVGGQRGACLGMPAWRRRVQVGDRGRVPGGVGWDRARLWGDFDSSEFKDAGRLLTPRYAKPSKDHWVW